MISNEREVLIPIENELKDSYLSYALSVIVSRALPDVRDGLKPVQRRILYSMKELGNFPNSPFKKSARIVGECFVKGTLVSTPEGLIPIEELTVGDKVYTQNGISEITELYIMPKQKLLEVELENGMKNIVTKGQMFKVLTEDLIFVWKKAENLKIGDYIVLRSTGLEKSEYFKIQDFTIDEDIGYLVGLFLSNGWIDRDKKREIKRVSFCSDNKEVLIYIKDILKQKFGINENILQGVNYYYLRINKKEINEKLINILGIKNKHSLNIDVPYYILRSPKSVIFSFISGYIDGDCSVNKNRKIVTISSISEKFIRNLQILLYSLGIKSKLYKTYPKKSKRKIKSKNVSFKLEISSKSYNKLIENISIKHPEKRKKLIIDSYTKPSKYEIIPFIGKTLFEESKEKDIGGEWYFGENNKKIRIGIKCNEKTKIKYSQDLLKKIKIYKNSTLTNSIIEKSKKINSKHLNFINSVFEKNLSFVKVKSVSESIEDVTYDIQVKNDHEFIANCMLSHNCLGKYHPHGDAPVYEALVRMAQDFTMRYPLVEGQGNFGSIDGDPPAAMRYTEVRLAPISLELLEDLEKETVEFRPNFDSTLKEPEVLPAKIPNILLNGASGIAVGMATNIPPHNLGEVIDALILLLRDREKSVDEIMKVLKGPDFPTKGVILNYDGIRSYFETGRGSVIIKGRGKFEKIGKILAYVIYEIPYNVNKANLIKRVVELVKSGKLKEIDDIRDESSKEGIRIVIELKKNADINVFERKLYEYTELKTSFPVNFVALINGKPKLLSIKEVLLSFLDFREEVITKRTLFELREEKRELKILTGIKKGIDKLDEVIEIIKSSKDREEARKRLIEFLEIDDEQSNAILDTRLSRLISIEIEKLIKDIKEKEENIKRLNEILTNREVLLKVIEDELLEIKRKYDDGRKTEIKEEKIEELSIKDIIQDEEVIVFLTCDGYIKRTNLHDFIVQNRGGKGIKGITLGREDEIKDIYFTSTHKNLYLFTDFGKVYSVPVYEIPEGEKKSKGEALHILLPLHPNESVTSIYTGNLDKKYILIFTSKGKVKLLDAQYLNNLRRNGIKIIGLDEGDYIKRVRVVSGEENIVVMTKKGNIAKFSLKKLKPQGRGARGVRGLRLRGGDEISSFDIDEKTKALFIITEKGKGKRISFEEIPLKNRGIFGMRGIRLKNDSVVAVRSVGEKDEVFIVTKNGKIIRIEVRDIPIQKRNASGVKVINIDEDDLVRGIALFKNEKV